MSDLAASINNKQAIVLACRIPNHIQEKLMVSAIEAAMHGKYDNTNEIQNFSETSGLEVEDILDLVGLYMSVIRMFMESDEKQFKEAMITAGFSEDFLGNFPLKHKSQAVSLVLNDGYRGIQKLSSFKWRVDISFACGVLKKQVPPAIIISLQLSNGQKYIFELDLYTFHRLRFNISLVFKEFMVLKKSNVLKNTNLL